MLPIRERYNVGILMIVGSIAVAIIATLVFTKPFDPDKLIDMSEVLDKAQKEEAARKEQEQKEHITRMKKNEEDFDSISEFMHEQHSDFKDCVEGWKQCDKSLDKLAGIIEKLDKEKYPDLGLDVMLYALYDGGLPDEKELRVRNERQK